LAYANAIAITEEVTERGFIPNMATTSGFKSRDRSQPPVGGITVQAICDRFGETVLAEELFDTLLGWNRWWPEHRDQDGYLCWGSDPYDPITGCNYETLPINTRFASALESGLDNSPMYEDMPYDDQKHLMQLADVGLMSFYIADCRALADLAGRIGRDDVVETERAGRPLRREAADAVVRRHRPVPEQAFGQRRVADRLSPTHFYPLLAGVPTQAQAERMIQRAHAQPRGVLGRLGAAVDRTRRPVVPEAGLLEGPHLGPDELPGLPGPAQVRPAGGPQGAWSRSPRRCC
jgi:putative isomerase